MMIFVWFGFDFIQREVLFDIIHMIKMSIYRTCPKGM